MENPNVNDLFKEVKNRKLHFVNTKAASNLNSTIFNAQFTKTIRDNIGCISFVGFEILIDKQSVIFKEINESRSIIQPGEKYNTKLVKIICDTLILKENLRVPTANINIYARKIVLENNVEISTQPLKYFPETSESDKGADGLNGGNISIYSNDIVNNGFSLKLITNGGNGQNAKQGKNGKDGNSVLNYLSYEEFDLRVNLGLGKKQIKIKTVFNYRVPDGTFEEYTKTKAQNSLLPISIKIPKFKESGFQCVAYQARWDQGIIGDFMKDLPTFGSFDITPTDGEDATAPGIPGEPGDAGKILFSVALNGKLQFENTGGYAGLKANDVKGGRRGRPEKWCYAAFDFIIKMFHEIDVSYDIKGTFKGDYIKVIDYKSYITKDGSDKGAVPAKRQRGNNSDVICDNNTNNCWIQPELLNLIYQYTKITYLKNESRESILELLAMLKEYKIALDSSDNSNVAKDIFLWNKTKLFINKMISQILTHRDYFNNEAGFMPLFNLVSSMSLYEQNISKSIRKLVLASYFKAQAERAFSEQQLLDEVNNEILSNVKKIINQYQTLKDNIKDVESEIEKILIKSDNITKDLILLEEKLIVEAKNNLHDEKIVKFGIKMGAALLQVIPYGQPALGEVGNVVSVIGDAYGKDINDHMKNVSDMLKAKSFIDILKKTKENLKDTTEALYTLESLSKEVKDENSAEVIRKKLIKFSIKSNEKKVNKTSRSKQLNAVGANVFSAFSNVYSAFSSLKITNEEFENSLNKIKISNSEWLKLQDQIIEINKEKSKFIIVYEKLVKEIFDNFEQAELNAISYSSIKELRGNKEGFRNAYVNNFFNSMEEETKDSLIYPLYLLTKSFEYTLFESIEMEWGSENIFDIVMSEVNKISDFDITKIDSVTKSLEEIFKLNLEKISKSLLENVGFINSKEIIRTLRFSKEDINQINKDGYIDINPVLYPGVISNNHHFIKIKDIVIEKDSINYGSISSIENLNPNNTISIRFAKEGLTRVSDKLYISRGDENVISWSLDSNKLWIKDPISQTAKDLFKTLIGAEYQDYFTLYPGITPLKLELNLLSQDNKKIAIEALEIKIKFDVVDLKSSDKSYVLNIMDANLPKSSHLLKNEFEIAYYPKNSITVIENTNESYSIIGNYYTIVRNPNVKLISDHNYQGYRFSHWEVKYANREPKRVENINLDISLDNVIAITPHFGLDLGLSSMSIGLNAIKSTNKFSERFIPQPLFSKPNEDQIYFISDSENIEILESIENGWMKINDNGVVGYVKEI